MNIPNEAILGICTVIGMIGHYAKKKAKSETNVSFMQWFGTHNIMGTIGSIITAAMSVIGVIANNLITADMSTYTIIYMGLTAGFAIDSATNGDGSSGTQ